jgi:hypothetical protein
MEMISGNPANLFPGHEPSQEQTTHKAPADGIVWFDMNEFVGSLNLVENLSLNPGEVALR